MNEITFRSNIKIDTKNRLKLLALLSERNLTVDLKAPKKYLYTDTIPQLILTLAENVPTIFTCECFNDKKLPFKKECENTEIAHLFEHILLEYLCKEKLKTGINDAEYAGVTTWDWDKEKLGVFHIEVNVGLADAKVFFNAYKNAVNLFKKIFTPTIENALQADDVISSTCN